MYSEYFPGIEYKFPMRASCHSLCFKGQIANCAIGIRNSVGSIHIFGREVARHGLHHKIPVFAGQNPASFHLEEGVRLDPLRLRVGVQGQCLGAETSADGMNGDVEKPWEDHGEIYHLFVMGMARNMFCWNMFCFFFFIRIPYQ